MTPPRTGKRSRLLDDKAEELGQHAINDPDQARDQYHGPDHDRSKDNRLAPRRPHDLAQLGAHFPHKARRLLKKPLRREFQRLTPRHRQVSRHAASHILVGRAVSARTVPQRNSAHNRWQARRDSNPQPTVLETAALPVRATGLRQALFETRVSGLPGFSMNSVCPAEPAVLLELDPGRIVLLVLHRRVVPALALSTSQRDDLSHEAHPHSARKTLENRFINLPHGVIHVKKRAALRRTLGHGLREKSTGRQDGAHDRD